MHCFENMFIMLWVYKGQKKSPVTFLSLYESVILINLRPEDLEQVLFVFLHIEIYSGCVTHESGIVYYEAV